MSRGTHGRATNISGQSVWTHTNRMWTPAEPPVDATTSDIVIIGGGLLGLWTAYHLRQATEADIMVVEADRVGGLAASRNGGWTSTKFPSSYDRLATFFGKQVARHVFQLMRQSVAAVHRFCQEADTAWGVESGVLTIAQSPADLAAVEARIHASAELELDNRLTRLSAADVRERLAARHAYGGVFEPNAAVVDPASLVSSLTRHLEESGVHFLESTRVTQVSVANSGPWQFAVDTSRGRLQASRVIQATESSGDPLGAARGKLARLYSVAGSTAPLDSDLWNQLGWRGFEAVTSFRPTVEYLTRTRDGRILIGGRPRRVPMGNHVRDRHWADNANHERLTRRLHEWFDLPAGIDLEYGWGGPVAITRDWIPIATSTPSGSLSVAYGLAGQGMTLSHLIGRALATAAVHGRNEAIDTYPLFGRCGPRWEIEPLRWLGINTVMRALEAVEGSARRRGRPLSGRSLPERLAAR